MNDVFIEGCLLYFRTAKSYYQTVCRWTSLYWIDFYQIEIKNVLLINGDYQCMHSNIQRFKRAEYFICGSLENLKISFVALLQLLFSSDSVINVQCKSLRLKDHSS